MSQFDELPEGWEEVRIEEIAQKVGSGATPRGGSKAYKKTGIPLIRSMNVHFDGLHEEGIVYLDENQAEELKNVEVKTDDVLLNITGASIGRVTQAPVKVDGARVNQHVCIIRPTENFNSAFLAKYLTSPKVQRVITAEEYGMTRQALTKQMILDFEIPLPPLNEQRRIVEKIEALTARSRKAREALEAIPNLLDQFRQSVLAAAFRGDLTADWREQNPDVEPAEVLLERIRVERRQRWEEAELERMRAKGKEPRDNSWREKYQDSQRFDGSTSYKVPSTWTLAYVNEFADVGTGATPRKGEVKYYENGSIPWITSGALNDLFVYNSEENITSLAVKETNAKIFPINTLLMAMYGEGKTRGKVSELMIEAATNQACAAILMSGLSTKIRPIVKLFFQKNYEDFRSLASGGVQPNLNLSMIKSTVVPLPPLPEQQIIIQIVSNCMSALDVVLKNYLDNLDSLDQLDQSILAKAFRGELVPQDPNDEPAAVLLERIRAERERLGNSKKRGKAKT